MVRGRLSTHNEVVEKVIEGSHKDIFGDSKTIPKREIVQYSAIVKVVFRP